MGSVWRVLVDRTISTNLQGPWLKHPGFFVFSAKATRAGQRQTDERAESRMESRREMKKWQAGDGPAPYPSTLEISRNGSGTGRLVQCAGIWFLDDGRHWRPQVTVNHPPTGYGVRIPGHPPCTIRLSVRTLPFHGRKSGSIPLWCTNFGSIVYRLV